MVALRRKIIIYEKKSLHFINHPYRYDEIDIKDYEKKNQFRDTLPFLYISLKYFLGSLIESHGLCGARSRERERFFAPISPQLTALENRIVKRRLGGPRLKLIKFANIHTHTHTHTCSSSCCKHFPIALFSRIPQHSS